MCSMARVPLLLVLLLLLPVAPAAEPAMAAPRGDDDADGPASDPVGLVVRLADVLSSDSAGSAPRADPGEDAASPGEPLDEDTSARLLARAPSLPEDVDPGVSFRFPPTTRPPPRAGSDRALPFPPESERAPPGVVVPDGLTILRRQPEGEVPIASHLSVTFAQPMVPLAAVADVAAGSQPVRLTPQLPGAWRWVGTRTVVFEPDERFEYSTHYRVEVGAGTRSALGGLMAEDAIWRFSTAAPRVVDHRPSGDGLVRQPLIVLAFDQPVHAADVLAQFELALEGPISNSGQAVRLAADEQIAAHAEAQNLIRQYGAERVVVLRTEALLPADSSITLKLSDGVRGREGTRLSETSWSRSFSTYAPLELVRHAATSDRPQQPNGWFWIDFNNALDEDSLTDELVTIEPSVPGFSVMAAGTRLFLVGDFRGHGLFSVSIAPDLSDRFGQTLTGGREVTLHVAPLDPHFLIEGGALQILDPVVEPSLSLVGWNVGEVQVDVCRVRAADWFEFRPWVYRHRSQGPPAWPMGELLTSAELDLSAGRDESVDKVLGLGSLLGENPGQLLVRTQWRGEEGLRSALQWVQRTNLGLHVAEDKDQLLVWVTDLSDGRPLADVEVTLASGEDLDHVTVRTDASGLARIPLQWAQRTAQCLLAKLGDDEVLLPENRWYSQNRSSSRWSRHEREDTPLFYVFDDRGLYKPGERVRIKGWVRQSQWKKGGTTVALSQPAGRVVGWKISDSRRIDMLEGTATLDAFGGFDLGFELPVDLNLGRATLSFVLDESVYAGQIHHRHMLQVQEFRLPEYEVTVTASPGSVVVGHDVDLGVEASYYTGGGLPDAPVWWTLDARPTTYAPPGWPNFSFGEWVPWWRHGPYHGGGAGTSPDGHWEWTARTDAGGQHRLRAELLTVDPPRAMRLEVQASVTDVNQQQWSGSNSVLVHPAEHYVGLQTERGFIHAGETLPLSVVVVDLDGRAMSDRSVSIEATCLAWVKRGGGWVQDEVARVQAALVSEAMPVTSQLLLTTGGRWTVTARCLDPEGRPNTSSRSVWVSGGDSRTTPELSLEELVLISDKPSHAPGDVAEVLVVSPFGGGHGLFSMRRDGVLSHGTFTMEGTSHTLRLPITEGHLPEVVLSVEVVGSALRTDFDGTPRPDQPSRPAYATGSVTLLVPPEIRRLHVAALPALPVVSPGTQTSVRVVVTGADGEPVPDVQVALVVVDEAVLAMTRRELADPLEVFHPVHAAHAYDLRGRDLVQLADPDVKVPDRFGALSDRRRHGEQGAPLDSAFDSVGEAAPKSGMRTSGYGGRSADFSSALPMRALGYLGAPEGGAAPAADETIRLRTNFDVLAAFVPGVVTDASGQADVPIDLPDRLTRYRVLAVAVDSGARAGLGEAALTARLPIMLRPSPPRFLNVGDVAELPVVVQNGLDEPLSVDVALAATGLSFSGHSTRRVLVPAQDRVELLFPVVADRPGKASLSIVASASLRPELADAATADFPVLTPATAEAFATYGQIEDGVTIQPLQPPTDALPGFGGLELSLTTTALAELTDAVVQLVTYPYQCAEQRASRVLALAVLGDVLAAFDAEGLPDPDALDAQIREDLSQLAALQNGDGGWSFWRRDERSQPYLSVHVTHALLLAAQAGWDVSSQVLSSGVAYVRDVRARLASLSPRLSPMSELVVRAYGLAVERRAGRNVADRAHDLLLAAPLDDWPLDGLGWMLPALAGDASLADDVTAVHRHVSNRVVESASTAHFVDAYDRAGQLVLASPRRSDAVMLAGLLESGLDEDLQPKLVRGLLSHRVKGSWRTTQENVFALLALSRYFELHESVTPELTAAMWLGDRLAAEQGFSGRSAERSNVTIPLDVLSEQGPTNLTVQADGQGRLYWRLGLRYAPVDPFSQAVSAGFTVERSYEALDDPGDVVRDETGVWHIRRGARVAVRLTVVNGSRRFHVALVDRLPAGLEILNSAFAVTGPIPEDQQALDPISFRHCWFWGRQWYDHENLRDDRAEVFALSLQPGVHHYSYVARATTPGAFLVPPVLAEEMYAPETFGRSAGVRVIIE